jgi:hypothetical protein
MKTTKRIGAFLLVILLITSLSSCFQSPKTAYDIALENGFVGGPAEWLDSLNGQDLDIRDIYAAACENGYSGDFLTFLSEYLSFDSGKLLESVNQGPINISKALLSSVSILCSFNC